MIVSVWAGPLFAMTREERLILWVGVLMAALVVGGIIIARLDRWRKRQMQEQDDAVEHVGSFRAMYERGELTKTEYEKVLWKMAEKAGAKPKPVPATTPTPPAAEPPATEEPPPTPQA